MLANEFSTFTLPIGQALTIVLGAGATCQVIERAANGSPSSPLIVSLTPTVFGPYHVTKTYTLIAVNGVVTFSIGALPSPELLSVITLEQSGVARPSANSTSEQALVTCVVPGGLAGINSSLEIFAIWTLTNNANAKALRNRLGGLAGTEYQNIAGANLVTVATMCRIVNRGALNSQLGLPVGLNAFGVTSTSAIVTSAIDMSVDQSVVISVQKGTGTDTATLETYTIKLVRDYNA